MEKTVKSERAAALCSSTTLEAPRAFTVDAPRRGYTYLFIHNTDAPMRGLRLGAPGSKILTLIQHFVRHAGPYTMLPMLNLARKRSNLRLLCAEASDTLTVDAPPRGYMYLFIYKAAPRFFEQL